MRIQQKVAWYEKIRKWKTGLIGQVNGSKVVYLSGNPNAGLISTCMLNITQHKKVIQTI